MSKFYVMGIQYDTDDIEEVVDKISDKTGWLVSSVHSIIPCRDENPDQVHLDISTDIGFTADFLRKLADAIENSGEEIEDYETFRGVATIKWPEGV